MLHVILLILKIIGIILAVILGLIILLLCIVLFVPIRYKLTSNATGNIKNAQALFKVSWLFHLISAKVSYQEEVLNWQVRIAWVKLGNQREKKAKSKPSKNIVKKSTVDQNQMKSEKLVLQEEQVRSEKVDIEDTKVPTQETPAPRQESKIEEQPVIQRSKKKEKGKFWQKIQNIFQKIKYTIKNIYDKIRTINNKKDEIMEFLRVDVHKRALQKLKAEGLKLLKVLMPRKFTADIVLGFEDPSTTGYFLAGYSMVFPFLPKRVIMRPDFERAVFEGKAMLKGYICIIWLVVFIWKMVWNKDVRKTYYDVREFEFKEGM